MKLSKKALAWEAYEEARATPVEKQYIEAMKVLSELGEIVYIAKSPERKAALQLGIEALKAIAADRCGDASLLNSLLPGETE